MARQPLPPAPPPHNPTAPGQVIDVLLSPKRDKKAARRFFTRALAGATSPTEVTTDRAPAYPRIVEDMLPGAVHVTVPYANNRVEADHGRLKARLTERIRRLEQDNQQLRDALARALGERRTADILGRPHARDTPNDAATKVIGPC